MDKLKELLQNPTKEYRGIPFWAWNDKLDRDMLNWQINEMDKAGLGGHIMHARAGLKTEYLSEEWMDCISTCVEESKKLGLNAWCYDENGWPSGFAGGIVNAMGDKFHVRWLEIEDIGTESAKLAENLLGVYKLDVSINKHERILPDNLGRNENERIHIIKHKSNPYYIDILNPEVVRAFIEVTHEKYYELFKEDFGKGIQGFFTDEPQFARKRIPWSYILPEEFQKRHGYAIIDNLPALFIECDGCEKIRYDFWETVSYLFVSSFGKQIYVLQDLLYPFH
ncbi:MAG TPA: hypothetical protein VHP38_06180 [Ruminiclostridium sp.]|nr:hypothetical protein [Ruminiclostridium sp.]